MQRTAEQIADQARRDFELSHQYFLKKLATMNAAAEHKAEVQAALVQGVLGGSGITLLLLALSWLAWKRFKAKFRIERIAAKA